MSQWQYLGSVEPPQTIARDLPISWAPVAEPLPPERAELPTAVIVAACFLVLPFVQPANTEWLPELEVPVPVQYAASYDTGAEFIAPAVARDLPIPWMPPLSEPVPPQFVVDPDTGAERPVNPVAVGVVAIPWAHQTEQPPDVFPPMLYGTGAEAIAAMIAFEGDLAWYTPLAEPPDAFVPFLYETGSELPHETVVREVVDRRVADFPDRVGSRSNRPRIIGI